MKYIYYIFILFIKYSNLDLDHCDDPALLLIVDVRSVELNSRHINTEFNSVYPCLESNRSMLIAQSLFVKKTRGMLE